MGRYEFNYKNELEFRKLERSLKKYNMLAYKKLIFEYYPNLKNGQFIGKPIKSEEDKVYYNLDLPTDSMFAKVHGTISLQYCVLIKEKTILLDTIQPKHILMEGNNHELTTYKGVMISKSSPEKDMFKINLLSSINLNSYSYNIYDRYNNSNSDNYNNFDYKSTKKETQKNTSKNEKDSSLVDQSYIFVDNEVYYIFKTLRRNKINYVIYTNMLINDKQDLNDENRFDKLEILFGKISETNDHRIIDENITESASKFLSSHIETNVKLKKEISNYKKYLNDLYNNCADIRSNVLSKLGELKKGIKDTDNELKEIQELLDKRYADNIEKKIINKWQFKFELIEKLIEDIKNKFETEPIYQNDDDKKHGCLYIMVLYLIIWGVSMLIVYMVVTNIYSI